VELPAGAEAAIRVELPIRAEAAIQAKSLGAPRRGVAPGGAHLKS
jgi:hypothetical protein